LIEVTGFAFFVVAAISGWISYQTVAIFLAVAIGLGILLSVSALLLEELSFHVYPKLSHTLTLLGAAVLENLGYRQMLAVWRLTALVRWAFGVKGRWGTMQRTGAWSEKTRLS
jgi:uncharacterized protein YacL